jgi:hypothetical protein
VRVAEALAKAEHAKVSHASLLELEAAVRNADADAAEQTVELGRRL